MYMSIKEATLSFEHDFTIEVISHLSLGLASKLKSEINFIIKNFFL